MQGDVLLTDVDAVASACCQLSHECWGLCDGG